MSHTPQPLLFRSSSPPAWKAVAAAVGGALLFILLVGGGMLVLLAKEHRGPSMLPGTIGGASVLPLGLMVFGLWKLRSVRTVTTDGQGLTVDRLGSRRRIEWREIAKLRREQGSDLLTGMVPVDVLRLVDDRGRTIVKLTGDLQGFGVLVAEIETRTATARGGPTYSAQESTAALRRRTLRRTRVNAAIGAVFAFGACGAIGFTLWEMRRDGRLAREGVETDARIVDRWMVRSTPWLKYAVRGEDGVEHLRSAMMEPRAWAALEGATTVRARVVPGDAEISRLARGEPRDEAPAWIVVLGGLVMGGFGLLMVAGWALGVVDVKLDGAGVRLVRVGEITDEFRGGGVAFRSGVRPPPLGGR